MPETARCPRKPLVRHAGPAAGRLRAARRGKRERFDFRDPPSLPFGYAQAGRPLEIIRTKALERDILRAPRRCIRNDPLPALEAILSCRRLGLGANGIA